MKLIVSLSQVMNITEHGSLTNLSYDETFNINSEVAVRGLSKNSLRKLPCFALLDGLKATESICSICLQVRNSSKIIKKAVLIICCYPFTNA